MKGEKAFDAYFSSVYGQRWPAIKQALFQEDLKVARHNQFSPLVEFKGVGKKHPFLEHCFSVDENFDLSLSDQNLLPYYRMDPASVIAARQLEIAQGQEVLDMCAAPGGKSLILAESLFVAGYQQQQQDLQGLLVVNEMSAKRRYRLMSVVKRYLPKEVRALVKVKGLDGSVFGLRQKQSFDKILLDAPCSGERGVVNKASELQTWTEKRSKSFAIRQYSLLASAFAALKSGGQIVYSTCSISPYENDGVIKKLMKRKSGEFEVEDLPALGPSETTEFGRQFLPDQQGWGPIFYSSIRKL